MSATVEKEGLIVSINGLDIREETTYKITNKPDGSAPDGFQKEGTTKLPSVGISNTIPCRFVNGVFDTGLYEQSPCYANMDLKEVKAIVRKLKSAIVTPYEKKWGKKGILDNHNTEFWESYGVNLEAGKFLNTNNVDQLLGLYISMRSFELTPKNLVGDPRFSESQFCIEDKEVVKSTEQERSNEIMNAIGEFQALLKSNPSKILNIFRYLGLVAFNEKIDKETMNSTGYTWLTADIQNPKKFLTVFKMTQDDATEDIVDIFVEVNNLYHKGVIDRKSGSYYYKGENLGADLKTVAKNLNSKKEFAELRIELLEQK